jgi:hypothetical protein
MARQDTKLESEGAEFLVLGHLLIEGIDAYKSYRNTRGYDVMALLPKKSRQARIQIKSRWASDANGFLIRNFECDFVVFAQLNRGFKYKYRSNPKKWKEGRQNATCYVLPIDVVERSKNKHSKWGQVALKQIPDFESYQENWELIRKFLKRRKG